MKTLNKFFNISFGLIIIFSFFVPNTSASTIRTSSLVKTAQAQTTPFAHPDGFQGTLRDHHCTDQEVAPWTTATPGGYFYTTDSNAKDPDCGRLNFMTQDVSQVPAAQSIYTDDFRVGIQIAESGNDNLTSCQPGQFIQQSPIAYTPWASEGGGSSVSTFTQYPNNDPDCYMIYYDTRPWPSGTPNIKDVQFGVSLGNGAMQFTPWARQGGGWSGYSAGGNIKPARVQMNITPIDLYDAQYSSDTVPDNMNQSQTGNYNVIVQNKATSWISDNLPSDSCQSQTPTADGQTCQATVNVSSNTIRLKRVDADAGIATPATGTKFTYARSITRTYTASYICVQWGVAMHNERKPSNLFGLIKHAQALMPIEDTGGGGGGDPGPTCTGYGYQYALSSQTPSNNNVVNTDTATFPMTVTIAAGATAGIHTMQFKMVQTDTNGNEISTGTYQGAFATPFNVNIIVGTPYTLTCDATHTVTSGTEAQYAISAAGTPNGNVSVTMTSNPTGPTMIDAPLIGKTNPLILSGGKTGNGYAGIAYVSTSSVPQGTYILTFSGVDATPTTVTCQSQLIVISVDPTVDLKFAAPGGRASDGPVTLQDQTSGTASWVSTNATGCTATSNPPLSSNDWNGSVVINSPKGGQSVTGFQYGTGYTLSIDCVNSLGTHVIDAVNVSVNATNPTATLKCDQGGGTYGAGPCTVISGSAGYLEWHSTFFVNCSIDNGIGNVPPPPQDTPFSTSNLSANTRYTLTCTGENGTTPATSFVDFNILVPPQKAGGPTVDNQSICSKMVVNWTYTGPPAADGFEIYWSNTSTSGPWTLISPAIGAGGALDGNVRSFTHNNPAANSNYYMVRSYHSGLYVDSNGVGPTGTQSCAPNLTTSDKEVLQLQRGSSIIKNKASQDCNGQSDVFTLPSNGLFRTGDVITFKINVCNTGNQTLTGVSVRDTLSNLSSPGTATFYPLGCGSGSYPNFSLSPIPPPDPKKGESNKICSVTFTAKVTAPSSTSSLYRFQNSADIGSNEAAYTVTTPPYLFQVGAGIPVRNETNK